MSDTDQTLEQLLSKASKRPKPTRAHVAEAREAVRAEWQSATREQHSRRTFMRMALAATVVIGVFVAFVSFRTVDGEIVKVAEIQKSFGAIYVLGDRSELTPAIDLATLHSGQTIVTGDDAGIALAWNSGGSLRLDANTQVEFRDARTVYLRSGRLYFDSTPNLLIEEHAAVAVESFRIETEIGVVSHVGTQFMTSVDDDSLVTTVREGRVVIDGELFSHTAEAGKQVVYKGQHRPVELSFPKYGAAWHWVGQVSPAVSMGDQSADKFLGWVSRELGMTFQYADDDVASLAREAILRGPVDTNPGEALRQKMHTAALSWEIVEGVIYVRNSD